jgi:hypothetical protein
LKLRCEIPGQQFVDAVDRMLGDTLEDASQVGLRIEANELGRLTSGSCGEDRTAYASTS